jgi:hypothetical protein
MRKETLPDRSNWGSRPTPSPSRPQTTGDPIDHLQGLNTARRTVRFTVDWTITKVDEDAIAALPEDARQSAVVRRVRLGWVLAANLAADLDAWTRLLGLHDDPELTHAEPATLRFCLWRLPARLVSHARRAP